MADTFPMILETLENIMVNGRVVECQWLVVMYEVPDTSGEDVEPVPVSWKRCLFEVLRDSRWCFHHK
jgi:hypothetical protein